MATQGYFDINEAFLKRKVEELTSNTHYTVAQVDQKFDRQLRIMKAHKWKSASKKRR